jgi:hypothetical protein
MVLINQVSLAVNAGIIVSSLIALRAISDELIISIRVFAVGSWIVDVFLLGLALVDVYNFLSFSWLSVLEYLLRIFEIFIYTIIAIQCVQLWNMYETAKEQNWKDAYFAVFLSILYVGIVIGFIVAIVISEENAWRVLYF